MTFDWTISLGNIITIFGFALSGLIAAAMLKSDVRMLGQRMGALEKDVDNIANVIVQIARQEERLSSIDRRANDLANRLYRIETGRALPPTGVMEP